MQVDACLLSGAEVGYSLDDADATLQDLFDQESVYLALESALLPLETSLRWLLDRQGGRIITAYVSDTPPTLPPTTHVVSGEVHFVECVNDPPTVLMLLDDKLVFRNDVHFFGLPNGEFNLRDESQMRRFCVGGPLDEAVEISQSFKDYLRRGKAYIGGGTTLMMMAAMLACALGTDVTQLEVYPVPQGAGCVEMISHFIQHTPSLQEVTIGSGDLSRKLEPLARAIATSSIRRLTLYAINLHDCDADLIRRMLRKNRTLRFVSLESNRLEDAGVEAILTGLDHNKSVKKLILKHNPVGGDMYDALCRGKRTDASTFDNGMLQE